LPLRDSATGSQTWTAKVSVLGAACRPGRAVEAAAPFGYAVDTRGPGSKPGPSPQAAAADAAIGVFLWAMSIPLAPAGGPGDCVSNPLIIWRRPGRRIGKPKGLPLSFQAACCLLAANSEQEVRLARLAQRTPAAGCPSNFWIQAARCGALTPSCLLGALVQACSPPGTASWIRLKPCGPTSQRWPPRRPELRPFGGRGSAWGASPALDLAVELEGG